MNLSDHVPTEESRLPGPGGNISAAHAAQTKGFLSPQGAESQLIGNITGSPCSKARSSRNILQAPEIRMAFRLETILYSHWCRSISPSVAEPS